MRVKFLRHLINKTMLNKMLEDLFCYQLEWDKERSAESAEVLLKVDRVCFIVGNDSPPRETGTTLQNLGVQHVQSLVHPGAVQAVEETLKVRV